jgi:lysophospholipase L1-like esterase
MGEQTVRFVPTRAGVKVCSLLGKSRVLFNTLSMHGSSSGGQPAVRPLSPDDRSQRIVHRRSIVSTALITLVIAMAILLVCEGLSRVVLTVRADLSSQEPGWYQYASDVGWERRPHFKGLVVGERHMQDPVRYLREFDAQGFFAQDTEQIHDTAHKRVLAIGDSNTFGYGVPTPNAFPEVLDDLREDADVINLGVSGYTSFQGHEILAKHFHTVRPDLVIASFSFNDRRVVPSEAAIDSREKFEREALSHQFDLVREKVYLFRVIQIVLSKLGLGKRRAETNLLVDARNARTRVSPEQYRQNLERIARFCREQQVPLVFVLFQDNPAHTDHLRAGITHLDHGQYEQAEAELRIAVNLDNWFSELARKYLAVVLDHRKASDEANSVATLTLPGGRLMHGGRPLHLDTEYNDIARAVAREYGAPVVEAGQALAQDASLYLDMAHPDERGHRLVAMLLNRAIDGLWREPQVAAQTPSH